MTSLIKTGLALLVTCLAGCTGANGALTANPWVLEGSSGPKACRLQLGSDGTFDYTCNTLIIYGQWKANSQSLEFKPTSGFVNFSCEFTLDGTRLKLSNCPIQYVFTAERTSRN